MTASHCAISCLIRASATTPMAKTTATARTRIFPGTMESRAKRTTTSSSRRAARINAICWRACCSRAERPCCRWARSLARRKPATTTPMRKTTKPPGSIGAGRTGSCWRSRADLIALRKNSPALTRDSFLLGAPLDETLIPDIEWRRADGALMREEDWRDGSATTLLACLYTPTEGARDADRVAIIWHRGDGGRDRHAAAATRRFRLEHSPRDGAGRACS